MQPYTVLVPIYLKENAIAFAGCIQSLLAQTVLPEEILVVCDGPITKELENVLENTQNQGYNTLSILRLEKNEGLGVALAKGVEAARNSLIGRMDADDFALPDRFEKQLIHFEKNPKLILLGTQIAEYNEDLTIQINEKKVPCTDLEIRAFAKSRNPFNHMTVMYRKESVLKAGNYRVMPGFEDYDLWIRMLLSSEGVVENLEEILMHCRAGDSLIERRGGKNYAKSCHYFLKTAYQEGFFTYSEYIKNRFIREGVAYLPNSVRGNFYRRFLRKNRD